MKKYNVDSFNLDHTKVTAPYVRLAAKKEGPKGDIVTKFDIRFCQPNQEFMPVAALHSLEHLVAEYIRDEIDGVIDFSPMGCRTGFYLTLFGDRTEEAVGTGMMSVLEKVAAWNDETPIPGTDPKECGNYREHDLAGAKFWASKWISGIKEKGFSCYV